MIPMTLRMKRCYGQNPISPSLYNQVLTPSVNLKILWSTSRKSLVKKRRDPRQSSPSARMWGHSEKTSYLQAKKKVLPTSTLILDFQTPKLWEISLLFKPLVCGILLGQPEQTEWRQVRPMAPSLVPTCRKLALIPTACMAILELHPGPHSGTLQQTEAPSRHRWWDEIPQFEPGSAYPRASVSPFIGIHLLPIWMNIEAGWPPGNALPILWKEFV